MTEDEGEQEGALKENEGKNEEEEPEQRLAKVQEARRSTQAHSTARLGWLP